VTLGMNSPASNDISPDLARGSDSDEVNSNSVPTRSALHLLWSAVLNLRLLRTLIAFALLQAQAAWSHGALAVGVPALSSKTASLLDIHGTLPIVMLRKPRHSCRAAM
jgi:hypothetical protein